MKIDININNIKSKAVAYFKDRPDQAIVVIILFVTIANAIFVSVIFYLAVLSPSNLDLGNNGYKYVRIKVNKEVLEKLGQREEIDQRIVSEIKKAGDPFNK